RLERVPEVHGVPVEDRIEVDELDDRLDRRARLREARPDRDAPVLFPRTALRVSRDAVDAEKAERLLRARSRAGRAGAARRGSRRGRASRTGGGRGVARARARTRSPALPRSTWLRHSLSS